MKKVPNQYLASFARRLVSFSGLKNLSCIRLFPHWAGKGNIIEKDPLCFACFSLSVVDTWKQISHFLGTFNQSNKSHRTEPILMDHRAATRRKKSSSTTQFVFKKERQRLLLPGSPSSSATSTPSPPLRSTSPSTVVFAVTPTSQTLMRKHVKVNSRAKHFARLTMYHFRRSLCQK